MHSENLFALCDPLAPVFKSTYFPQETSSKSAKKKPDVDFNLFSDSSQKASTSGNSFNC